MHSNTANTPGQPVTSGGVALLAGGERMSVVGIVSDTVMAQLATVAPAIYMHTLPAALLCRLLEPPVCPNLTSRGRPCCHRSPSRKYRGYTSQSRYCMPVPLTPNPGGETVWLAWVETEANLSDQSSRCLAALCPASTALPADSRSCVSKLPRLVRAGRLNTVAGARAILHLRFPPLT